MIINNTNSQKMSYFQKYQKLCNNSRTTNHTNESQTNEHNSTAEFKQKNHSRHSYLKAFKKYYIDQLANQQQTSQIAYSQQNKQNFFFHQPNKDKTNSTFTHEKSIKQIQNFKKLSNHEKKSIQQGSTPKISRSKVTELVNTKQYQLQQLIYNSISEMERQVMSFGENGELLKQNKMLRASIQKMKVILKQKLKEALTKNKEQLTVMFEEYSTMIKKLLEDKQKLTTQLESYKGKLQQEETVKRHLEQSYENRIKIMTQENNEQIANTKKQVEEFLDMIIQYEEEANAEKAEFQRMREKMVELQMENDKLKNELNSFRNHEVSSKINESYSERQVCTQKSSEMGSKSGEQSFENSRDRDGQTTNKYVTNRNSDEDEQLNEIERYAEKIQNLLDMLDRLQDENKQLNEFLKSCKCSRIKQKRMENSDSDGVSSEQARREYEKKLIQAEKEYIRQEMCLREAIRKKDQCIERLTLVIDEIRKARYESVDRITHQAIQKQANK